MENKLKIKKVVAEIKVLCKSNQFKQAGNLAIKNKSCFIEMIKQGSNSDLLYAYRVCSIFNMRQIDCFNLRF